MNSFGTAIAALAFLVSSGAAQNVESLPDLPTPQPSLGLSPSPRLIQSDIDVMIVTPPKPRVTFWTFRKSWKESPLRSTRQVFKSKWFLLGAAADFAAMAVACNNSRSGEHLSQELPAQIAVQALNFVSMRYLAEWYVPPVDAYATQHYVRAALK